MPTPRLARKTAIDRVAGVATRQIERASPHDVVEQAGFAEDPRLEDHRQAEALGWTEGMTLEPLVATSDNRYELVRVIRR